MENKGFSLSNCPGDSFLPSEKEARTRLIQTGTITKEYMTAILGDPMKGVSLVLPKPVVGQGQEIQTSIAK